MTALARVEEHILRVAVSTTEAPKFGVDLIDHLANVLRIIDGDDSIRAVILTGGPRYFSAGGDSRALIEPDEGRNILVRALEIPHLLVDVPVPTIAAMAGHAIGGGFMVGMWCDIPLLAMESRYGMNAVTLGIPPVMGAAELLPELVGPALTHTLLYTGRLYKGRVFREAGGGLAHGVCPKREVEDRALAIAQEIVEAPRDTIALTKSRLLKRRRAILAQIGESEERMLRSLLAHPGALQQIADRYPVPLNV